MNLVTIRNIVMMMEPAGVAPPLPPSDAMNVANSYIDFVSVPTNQQQAVKTFANATKDFLFKFYCLYFFLGNDWRVNFVHPSNNAWAFYLLNSGTQTSKGVSISNRLNTQFDISLATVRPNVGGFYYSQAPIAGSAWNNIGANTFGLYPYDSGNTNFYIGSSLVQSNNPTNTRGFNLFQRNAGKVEVYKSTGKISEAAVSEDNSYLVEFPTYFNPSDLTMEISAFGFFEALTESEVAIFSSALATLMSALNRA